MIGEIVSDMHGMEQGRRSGGGRRRQRRRGRRRWSSADERCGRRSSVDERCGSKRRTPASAARHRDARPPTSTPTPPVGGKVGGRSAALVVAGDRTGERHTKVGLPSILQDLDYLSFFNPTESDPNLSKANRYPYPIRFKSNQV